MTLKNKKPPQQIALIDNTQSFNIDNLKQNMLQEMYVLERCLFQQASKESVQITQLRELLSQLQTLTFSTEAMNEMSSYEKLAAYRTLSSNLTNSMNFMMELHKTVGKGFEVIDQLEKTKREQETQEPSTDFQGIENIKNLLINGIKKKIREK